MMLSDADGMWRGAGLMRGPHFQAALCPLRPLKDPELSTVTAVV